MSAPVHASGSLAPPARVFVTGLGCVTPFGIGVEAFARGLASARAAFDEVTLFPSAGHRTRLAGEVRAELGPALADLAPRVRRHLSRTDAFAVLAAREALSDAALAPEDGEAGVFLGSSTGGMFEGEEFFWRLRATGGRARVSDIASQQHNGPADAVARAFGLHGPLVTMSSACSAASMAFEAALASLRAGETDVALAGGADGLCRLTYAGFNALRAVDEAPCRPFRADRAGLSLGEGAALLVLETEAHARARGARVHGEFLGAGSSCDAHHMTAPKEDGSGLALAVEKALADARIGPADVDAVNAHGTATPLNDAAEWRGLTAVFGERVRELVFLPTKASIGHLLGAAGGAEAVASLLALRAGCATRVPGEGPLDPDCPARFADAAELPLAHDATILSVNLAFGGANAAVLLRGVRP